MHSQNPLLVLALLFISVITGIATPVATTAAATNDTPGFKSQFLVQPPSNIDTNIYQRLPDGTHVVAYNSTTTTDEPSAYNIDCDTTIASPRYWNVYEAARHLENSGIEWCTQNTPHGSRCSRWASEGDAALAVCGRVGSEVKCSFLAWSARQIVVWCNWNDYAGGKYIWNPNLMGIVY